MMVLNDLVKSTLAVHNKYWKKRSSGGVINEGDSLPISHPDIKIPHGIREQLSMVILPLGSLDEFGVLYLYN